MSKATAKIDFTSMASRTVPVLKIDAETAKLILEKNRNNRPYGKPLAKRYAAQMLAGTWDYDLPIVIYTDKSGHMHNGQHSLNALILAEEERLTKPSYYKDNYNIPNRPLTITAVVVDGIKDESANYLDSGKPRTAADVAFRQHFYDKSAIDSGEGKLRVPTGPEQKTLGRLLSTAAKIIFFRLNHGEKVRSSRKFEHGDLIQTLENHPSLNDFVFKAFVENLNSGKALAGLVNPAYVAAAAYLMAFSDDDVTGKYVDEANDFIDNLANGSEKEKGLPVHELREWLTAQKNGKNNAVLNRIFDALIVAMVAFRDKKKVERKVYNVKETDFPTLGGIDVLPEVQVEETEDDDSDE